MKITVMLLQVKKLLAIRRWAWHKPFPSSFKKNMALQTPDLELLALEL